MWRNFTLNYQAVILIILISPERPKRYLSWSKFDQAPLHQGIISPDQKDSRTPPQKINVAIQIIAGFFAYLRKIIELGQDVEISQAGWSDMAEIMSIYLFITIHAIILAKRKFGSGKEETSLS
jgi:hypothetical protein